jgi:hypothetical protein
LTTPLQSLQPALLRVAGLICIAAIVVLSLLPGRWQAHTGAPGPLEHFVAYFLTAAIVGWDYRSRPRPLTAVIFFFALAGSMEILQHWAPGRDPAWVGFLASGSGAAVGTWMVHWLHPSPDV